MENYRYSKLIAKNQFRVLNLDPGHEGSLLSGKLEIVSVEATGEYEALSYVWAEPGPPDTPYSITISDQHNGDRTLRLRGGSIFAALSHVRRPDRCRRIWADQCCINQDDVEERSQQVQFMNRIYQNAQGVVGWIGLDLKREAFAAFKLVAELDLLLGSNDSLGSRASKHCVGLEQHIKDNVGAIRALTNKSYFRRGWIVQEIGTRTPATLMWGIHSISWNTLASVCERLKKHHEVRNQLKITTSDISFLFHNFTEPDERTHHANRLNFVYELQRARHLEFTDDRDRIFAFLGHYSVNTGPPLGCGPVITKADYALSVEDTYVSFAQQLLEASPAAACILLASVQHSEESLSLQMAKINGAVSIKNLLPSWVPDWRTRQGSIILAEPICPHRAHGTSNVELSIMNSERPMIKVFGVQFDSVNEVSEVLLARDFYQARKYSATRSVLEYLWQEICRFQNFDLKHKYVTGESAFFAFSQTLSNGCVQAAGHACVPYEQVDLKEWLRMAAKYFVQIFEPSGNISQTLRDAADSQSKVPIQDEWVRWATSAAERRKFAVARLGYYVLGPEALRVGDVICVFSGMKVPLCLRKINESYLLVGECYVHGIMSGELFSDGNFVGRDGKYFEIH